MLIFDNNKRFYVALVFIIILLILLIPKFEKNEVESDVIIFVLDTEIDFQYLERGITDFSREISHGTMVARIINREAPSANIKGRPVEGIESYKNHLKEIINYVHQYPDKKIFINISLAFQKDDPKHQQLIKRLNNLGVKIVAAAGNNNSSEKIFPAGYENNVIAVANASKSGKAESSNYGKYVDLSAPGSLNFVARLYFPGRQLYREIETGGTSFSAPRVTGLAAEIVSRNPEFSPEQAMNLIIENFLAIDDEYYQDGLLGSGVLNKTSVMKQVDKLYLFREIFNNFFFPIAVFTLVLFIIYKTGIIALFVILFAIFLQAAEPFHSLFYENITMYNLLTIFLSLFFVRIITYWSNKILISIYTLILGLQLFSSTPIPNYLTIIFILILLLIERFIYMNLSKKDNKCLLKALNSNSNLISSRSCKLLEKRLDNNKIAMSRLINHISKSGIKGTKYLMHILANSKKPPVSLLIKFTKYGEIIKSGLKEINSKIIVKTLVKKLKETSNNERRKLIIDILEDVSATLVVPQIYQQLNSKKLSNKVLWALFKLLRKYGEKVVEIEPSILKKLAKYTEETKDSWTRMYALRTIAAVYPEKENLKSFIKLFIHEKDSLVQTEARGILKNL